MKCHALNYSASCLPQLRACANNYGERGFPVSALATHNLANNIEQAQHFVLPDGGRLLNDGLRGMGGRKIKLPFPSITVEYIAHAQPWEKVGVGEARVECSRRIVHATETTYDRVLKLLTSFGPLVQCPPEPVGEQLFMLSFANWVDMRQHWQPLVTALILSETWDVAPFDWAKFTPYYKEHYDHKAKVARKGCPVIGMWPVPLLWELAQEALGTVPVPQAAFEDLVRDVMHETTAVLELCEALTCVNVHIDKLQSTPKAVNDKRAAAGKMRLPDAWCLTIDVPAELKQAGPWKGGTHRSPRTHLRRGHIRRKPSGNYWINSTIVGSGDVKIDKHYHLNPKRSPHHHHEGKHHG